MFDRKLFIIFSISILSVFSLTGCMDTSTNIANKDYTNYEYNTGNTEVDTSIKNVIDRSSGGGSITDINLKNRDNDLFMKPEDKIGTIDKKGRTDIITYKELAERLSDTLQFKLQDYRIKEHLIYNYTFIEQLNLNGVYLDETVDTVRKSDQYYRDDQRTTGKNSFNRKVEGIKYKDKANLEVIKGTFSTREKKKPVELEWKEIEFDENSEDIKNFKDIKEFDFLKIDRFYYYTNDEDFKARGTATLKDFLTWCSIKNSGISTLKDNKVVITREFIDKGVTTEKQVTVSPLKATFDFDITVKKNDNQELEITLTADLTNALTTYYKVYENYDIIDASYELNILRYSTSEDIFKEDNKEDSDEASTSETEENISNN